MKKIEIQPPRLASLYTAVDVIQPLGPLLVGERANATGSKKFRELLLADDFDGMLKLLQSQTASHVLDISVAYTGRDEAADMRKIAGMAAAGVSQPLMLDSSSPEAIEAALKLYPGRPVINSVNLEDGGKTLSRVAGLAKKYGAMLTGLTIDEKGMALDAARKVEIALRMREIFTGIGLRGSDIFFDCLTFSIGSGDESLYNAAAETLAAIRELKRLLPDCHTLLGVSNVSYGLSPACRHVVNSVFLAEAVSAGLDAAIVDAAKILPLRDISPAEKELAFDLIYNRRGGGKDPLAAIIRYFSTQTAGDKTRAEAGLPAEALLGEKIMHGSREGLEDILFVLLEKYSPADIINNLLVPVMRKIGVLFGKGEMLLPFVLAAAETMRGAVRILEPFLPRGAEEKSTGRKKIVLATVQGDVHDIGKNLVDIILSNNGYTVFNIGIKQSAQTIMAKAREYNADVIALSGLLVKSALCMKDNLKVFAENGLTLPVFLGGAALTRSFVAGECAPLYGGPVVYCKDPFDALAALEALQSGRLESTRADEADGGGPPAREGSGVLPRPCPRAEPPFLGARHVGDFSLTEVLRNFSKNMLFRGRWGFHKKALSAHEYEKLISGSAEPQFSQALAFLEPRLDFQAAYGYFPCRAEGNRLVVENGGETFVFDFPRQKQPDGLCVADFFRAEPGEKAFVPFFALTIGKAAAARVREAFEKDSYKQYLFLHGLAAELTDALAETLTKRVAAELGLAALTGRPDFTGTRYGFGYPACPNLDLQRPLFELLRAGNIGIELTETNMLEPEYSTAGLIAYHPEAKYFSV